MSAPASSSSATVAPVLPRSLQNARNDCMQKTQKAAVALGRKISEIDPEEAKKYGAAAVVVAVANGTLILGAKATLYSWDLVTSCVASVVGDFLSTPLTVAVVAVGGAVICKKIADKLDAERVE